jgi:MFS transporter, AAHS family, 4-hydroxybenzoate transporter
VSWANAVGRSGSLVGSMIGGYLLHIGWSLGTVFAAAAIPALVAAIAIFAKGRLKTTIIRVAPVTAGRVS